MHKTTTAVLAASTGLLLLAGGAGTLAYWSESKDVGGTTIAGGRLDLTTDSTNAGCGAWQLDSGESASFTYAAGDPLVPGDVLTRTCRYTIVAQGNHLRATVGLGSATFSGTDGNLGGKLTAAVSATVDGTAATSFTEAADGKTLAATVTVTWNSDDTGHEGASSVLDDLTLTATQSHS